MAPGQSNDSSMNGTTSARRHNASDEESTPLLNQTSRPTKSWSTRLHKHLTRDIDNAHADIPLLVCYIITGLLDSSSILIWGSFVSMQTGNTIYLGLGLADPSSGTRWIKAFVSIACFCFGSFVFARWHRNLGLKKRWVLASSYVIQTVMIAAAAIVLMIDVEDDGDLRWEVLVGIALVAFQAGGQAFTSRALKFNALTSVVLTSIYCDLFGDANLFAAPSQNVERNQRLAAPICLVVGAILGGALGKTGHGIVAALWIAAGTKFILTVAWMLWKSAPEED